jgi:hypothetical protein
MFYNKKLHQRGRERPSQKLAAVLKREHVFIIGMGKERTFLPRQIAKAQ